MIGVATSLQTFQKYNCQIWIYLLIIRNGEEKRWWGAFLFMKDPFKHEWLTHKLFKALSCSNYEDEDDADEDGGIDEDDDDASENDSEQARNSDKKLSEVRDEVFC